MNIVFAIVVLGVLGAVFGLVLAIASKIFEVKKDPREEAILSHLAGANCGGCGYPGCAGCAAAILAGDAPVTACAPAGAENAAAIAQIMGQEAPTGERQVAFARCNGGTAAKKRFEYIGVQDCLSATKVAAGPLECEFGCLGFGSCVKACQFGAMSIGPNGTAVVDPDKCTACMACASACPRHLITSVPASKKVHVACANRDKGKAAMSVCATPASAAACARRSASSTPSTWWTAWLSSTMTSARAASSAPRSAPVTPSFPSLPPRRRKSTRLSRRLRLKRPRPLPRLPRLSSKTEKKSPGSLDSGDFFYCLFPGKEI